MDRLKTLVIVLLASCGLVATDAAAATVKDLLDTVSQAVTSAQDTTKAAAAQAVAEQERRNQEDLLASLARAQTALGDARTTLTEAGVLEHDITAFAKQYVTPDALALARRRQHQFTARIDEAIDTIMAVSQSILPESALTQQLRDQVNALHVPGIDAGQQWNLETLRLLERKYGPKSAKLNGIEVLAAYVLQRNSAFGVDATGRPGPFEVVCAYVPTYLTRSDETMRVVGVAEVGMRQYIFKQTWGGNGRFAFLRPGYVSYGMAVSGREDDPMRPPWQGASRFGAFFGWGAMKVAWLGGDDQRVLVTQQFQMLPFIF
jgi:polyhydroxyalkanoate synthesis regulator protein